MTSCRRSPWVRWRIFSGLAGFAVAGLQSHGAESATWKFDFSPGAAREGYTQVSPDSVYSTERGYGFEPGPAIVTTGKRPGESDRDGYVTADRPFLFSAAVPEGNYRVTVRVGGAAEKGSVTIKAESRRLMLEAAETTPNEYVSCSFMVNVRNAKVPPPPLNAPGNDHVELNNREQPEKGPLVYHWDDKLTLEFNGSRPALSRLEIERVENLPTVFLVGDSTVTDQPREPGASWGQMLTRFFGPDVAVANHAESGETLKSFITELRLDKALSQMKKGDYLFIQFGHNDEKSSWPQTYVEANTTYKAYLKAYIAEARLRGATPVLVSPMQRRMFDGAKIKNSHGAYPEAVRQVAEEEKVAFIDLSKMSAAFYEALGPDKSPLAFSNGGKDPTHHNNYGAYELAKCVIQGIRDNHLPLAESIVSDFKTFDPAKPDAPETFALPASPGRSNVAPRGN